MSETSPSDVKPSRTVNGAAIAVAAQVAMGIIGALLLFGYSDYLREQMLDANRKAIADKKDKLPYNVLDIAHDVHQSQTSGLIGALLFGAIFLLLAYLFWRGRGWARWVLIIAAILTQQPFRVLGFGGTAPAALRVTIVLGGLASLASIVLLLLPESNRYFSAKRGGPIGGGATASPFSLRTLFGPRPPRRAEPASAPQRPVTQVVRPPAKNEPAKSEPARTEPARTEPVGATPAATTAPRAKSKARVAPAETSAPGRGAAPKSRGKAKGR